MPSHSSVFAKRRQTRAPVLAQGHRTRVVPLHWRDILSYAPIEGPEGQQLVAAVEQLRRYLLDHDTWFQILLSAEARDTARYNPIPPKASYTTSVYYRHEGRGKPLPYPIGDED